jgi:hypothetical protein
MKKGATQDATKNVLWTDACHKTNLETRAFGCSGIDVSDIDFPNVQVDGMWASTRPASLWSAAHFDVELAD